MTTQQSSVLDRLAKTVLKASDSTGKSITSPEVPLVIHRLLERLISNPDLEVRIQEALDDIRYGS